MVRAKNASGECFARCNARYISSTMNFSFSTRLEIISHFFGIRPAIMAVSYK